MATQTKSGNSKTTNRGAGNGRSGSNQGRRSPQTNRGRNSGNRKTGGNKGGTDTLTKVFFVLLVVTILMIIAAIVSWKKDQPDDSNTPTPKPTQSVSNDLTKAAEEKKPTKKPEKETKATETPVPTKAAENEPENTPTEAPTPAPTATPAPTSTPTPTPVPEPEPEVTLDQAKRVLEENFGNEYKFSLSDDHLYLNGSTYYCYFVNYNGKDQDYAVLINRESGKLYYYDGNEVTTQKIENSTGDGSEVGDGTGSDANEEGMTAQKAVSSLAGLSAGQLNLPASLEECTVSLDQWTTMIDGNNCYCLNVFYQDSLAGILYFTEEAEHVYYADDFGDFVKVK